MQRSCHRGTLTKPNSELVANATCGWIGGGGGGRDGRRGVSFPISGCNDALREPNELNDAVGPSLSPCSVSSTCLSSNSED